MEKAHPSFPLAGPASPSSPSWATRSFWPTRPSRAPPLRGPAALPVYARGPTRLSHSSRALAQPPARSPWRGLARALPFPHHPGPARALPSSLTCGAAEVSLTTTWPSAHAVTSGWSPPVSNILFLSLSLLGAQKLNPTFAA